MSLRIPYNSSSNTLIVFTLAESVSGITSGQTFNIQFENEQDGVIYSRNVQDSSNYPVRFNRFTITTDLTGTTSNNFPLATEGWYQYKVFEYSGSTTALETGKCYAYSDSTPISNTYTTSTNKYIYKK